MTGKISDPTLIPVTIADDDQLLKKGVKAEDVEFLVVKGADDWLRAAYTLLRTEFDSSVLDPYERFVEWIKLNAADKHPFPFLVMVAFVKDDKFAKVVGVISGNIMKIENYVPAKEKSKEDRYIFAIGNQLTASSLRKAGIKGIGTRLLDSAVEEAREWIRTLGGVFAFSLLEAENESVGFWSKAGFLWPRDVRYWQPPLEFDSKGNYVEAEVPEILMVRPTARVAEPEIDTTILKNAIATVYLNWSLFKYRKTLGRKAMKIAEDYVMKDLFGDVCRRMPKEKTVRLISLNLKKGGDLRRHFRSVALSRGSERKLTPLRSPELDRMGDFDDMLDAMSNMAFGARTVGNAAEVLMGMASDKKCKVVLTLSGAATVAKLDLIIAEMIQRGLIHCIVSTGEMITHSFCSEKSGAHFEVPEDTTDIRLYESGFNRIYDSLETEYALEELEDAISEILHDLPAERPVCSSDIVRLLGKHLHDAGKETGLLQTAYRKNVPIFIPSFTDGRIGLDFALFNRGKTRSESNELHFDPFLDFNRYCAFIEKSDTRGIVTLGGDVPRNWAQQVGKYFDAIERRENAIAVKDVRFKYAVRISPDPEYWGGSSGSTYSERISWGEIVSPDEGGMSAEVFSDYTLVFPLLIKGLFERLDKSHKARKRGK